MSAEAASPAATRPRPRPAGEPWGSTASDRADQATVDDDPASPRPRVTLGELLVLGAVLAIALAGWLSLGLAHWGHHNGVVVLIATAVVVAAAAFAVLRSGVPVRVDGRELLVLGGAVVVAAVMFFPGFPYAAGDKDPGVYVIHGYEIARTGSYDFDNPAIKPGLPVAETTPNAPFPGIWVNDPPDRSRIVPQFFHYFPALLATAHDLGGDRALFNVVPVAMTVAALAPLLAVRRAIGWIPAVLAFAFLATNMMEVWAAKYPATEALSQMLTVGAILGVIVSMRTGWRVAAGLAGLFAGIGLLVRPDGILVVMFAVAVGALLVAIRRFDARAVWFAVGMALPLPHAFVQAYDFDFSARYAKITHVPRPLTLLAITAVLYGGAFVFRSWVAPRGAALLERRAPWLDARRASLLAGGAITAVLVAYVAFVYLRPELLGQHITFNNGVRFRDYNEQNMERLSWFLTYPGVALMLVGAAVLALRRWHAYSWALVLPGLALFPLYVFQARISPHLMWWTRRYIPFVLTAVVVLIAIAVAWLLTRRGRQGLVFRAAGIGLTAYLLISSLSMSWPLRSHDEFGGSLAAVTEITKRSGADRAVFLFRPSEGGGSMTAPALFGGSLWLIKGQVSTLFSRDAGPETVEAYRNAFPDLPIVLLNTEPGLPPKLQGMPFERLEPLDVGLPIWEWQWVKRPDRATTLPAHLDVWRLPPKVPAEPAA